MTYNKYTLKELATIRYGKNQKNVVSSDGSFPIYGTGGLMGYASKYLYDKPSVLIGRKGTIDKVRYVTHPFWTVDTLFYTEINDAIVIPHFLYYVLSLLNLRKYNEGTSIPSLRIETLNRLELYIPPLSEQKKILSFIEPIEEKIDINSRINRNLSEQAQAIYESWFVSFEKFGGMVPLDWGEGVLGDIAEIKTTTFKPDKEPDVIVEHYSIPALDEKHFPIFELAEGIKSNKYLLNKNSVMISKLNPDIKRIWRPMCLSDRSVCSTEFIVFEAKNKKNKDFIFSILDSDNFSNHLCSHVTGSTGSRQRAVPKATLDFKVLIPPSEVIEQFCSMVTPIYDLIGVNEIENQRLSELRDSLLPKLMSGELNVSSLNI